MKYIRVVALGLIVVACCYNVIAKPRKERSVLKVPEHRVTLEILDERLTRLEERFKKVEESNGNILRAFKSLGEEAPKRYWEEDDYEPIIPAG